MKRSILFTFSIICFAGCLLTLLVGWTHKPARPENNITAIQSSVTRGFTLLQTSGAIMITKSKCASCHHSTMTSMVAATMAKKGITNIDTTARMREMAMLGSLDFIGNPNLNTQFVTAKFLAPYILLGLHAEKHPADITTDISVDYLMSQAMPDGSYKAECARVPLECGDIHLTAMATRAIDLYVSPARRQQAQLLLTRARAWMEKQHPTQQQELAFQLLGLHWTGSSQSAKDAIAQQLLALQNKDGGWSQLPSMKSDAYATGQSLYALEQSGSMAVSNAAFQKGINYLLASQDASGAWLMVTRSNPIQPFVNTQFPPYDDNQFIAAAATNWAVLALAEALPSVQ
ncbi:MAG TPA: prenyltransferase/squalene oxidase repeat-containing protein [Chitinophagaceae bacterium]|nr:prenyltransferase/squalene oxidase repeat-containing protein [Chitinophagaceae bacterium]